MLNCTWNYYIPDKNSSGYKAKLEYERFCERDLSGFDVVYLFVDGAYESLRQMVVMKETILCCWAITSAGHKMLLHIGLGNNETLMFNLGGSRLRIDLDRIPLWRGNHVLVRQLADDFFKYIYLPRLKKISVLINAIEDVVRLMSWERDSFAYADAWDDEVKRYRGLKACQAITVGMNSEAVLIKPEIASKQIDEEKKTSKKHEVEEEEKGKGETGEGGEEIGPEAPNIKRIRRFYGRVNLDPLRAGRDAGKISEEVIHHMFGLVDSKVKLALEFQIEAPHGIPEDKQRIVNENCSTLKFESFEFEEK